MTWSLHYDLILRTLSDIHKRINTERCVNIIRNGRSVFPRPAAAKFEMGTKHGSSPELWGHTAWAKKVPYMPSRNSLVLHLDQHNLKGCTILGGIYRLQLVRYGPTKVYRCHKNDNQIEAVDHHVLGLLLGHDSVWSGSSWPIFRTK